MQIKMESLLTLVTIGILVISGCGDDGTGTGEEEDSITILSVIPDSGLSPNTQTDFIVNIEYELASADSGELLVGFNNVEVGRYYIVEDATVLVAQGSGEHQFDVTAVTTDWGDDGDFGVYVNLSEHPHEFTWTPLAIDIRVLTF